MSTAYTTSLNVPASVAAGTANTEGNYLGQVISLIVTGAMSATFRVQASVDGTNWADATGDITAATILAILGAPFYRVNCSAYTSGTPKFWLHGRG